MNQFEVSEASRIGKYKYDSSLEVVIMPDLVVYGGRICVIPFHLIGLTEENEDPATVRSPPFTMQVIPPSIGLCHAREVPVCRSGFF
jgi:hypothetical protein